MFFLSLQADLTNKIHQQLLQGTYKPAAYYTPCSDQDVSPVDVSPNVLQECSEAETQGDDIDKQILENPAVIAEGAFVTRCCQKLTQSQPPAAPVTMEAIVTAVSAMAITCSMLSVCILSASR